VIDEDPDHKPPSDSDVNDNGYRPWSKLLSSHMDEDGGTLESEDGAEPEGNTDRDKMMRQRRYQSGAPFAANLQW
jgi:hypothetical protein